jgi:hypothetical protein
MFTTRRLQAVFCQRRRHRVAEGNVLWNCRSSSSAAALRKPQRNKADTGPLSDCGELAFAWSSALIASRKTRMARGEPTWTTKSSCKICQSPSGRSFIPCAGDGSWTAIQGKNLFVSVIRQRRRTARAQKRGQFLALGPLVPDFPLLKMTQSE